MRTYAFTPLCRSTVGFDRLFDLINNSVTSNGQDSYPPYDIVRTGQDTYRIAIPMAGFAPEDITVTAQENLLVVAARPGEKREHHDFIHRGISGRAFERRFSLADYVNVQRANYADGLLIVDLVRKIPEAKKPRRIQIDRSVSGKDNLKHRDEVAMAA